MRRILSACAGTHTRSPKRDLVWSNANLVLVAVTLFGLLGMTWMTMCWFVRFAVCSGGFTILFGDNEKSDLRVDKRDLSSAHPRGRNKIDPVCFKKLLFSGNCSWLSSPPGEHIARFTRFWLDRQNFKIFLQTPSGWARVKAKWILKSRARSVLSTLRWTWTRGGGGRTHWVLLHVMNFRWTTRKWKWTTRSDKTSNPGFTRLVIYKFFKSWARSVLSTYAGTQIWSWLLTG